MQATVIWGRQNRDSQMCHSKDQSKSRALGVTAVDWMYRTPCASRSGSVVPWMEKGSLPGEPAGTMNESLLSRKSLYSMVERL